MIVKTYVYCHCPPVNGASGDEDEHKNDDDAGHRQDRCNSTYLPTTIEEGGGKVLVVVDCGTKNKKNIYFKLQL